MTTDTLPIHDGETSFPVTLDDGHEVILELVSFDRPMTEEEIRAAYKAQGLRPITTEEYLAFYSNHTRGIPAGFKIGAFDVQILGTDEANFPEMPYISDDADFLEESRWLAMPYWTVREWSPDWRFILAKA